jgi:hypothetical protein
MQRGLCNLLLNSVDFLSKYEWEPFFGFPIFRYYINYVFPTFTESSVYEPIDSFVTFKAYPVLD